MGVDGAVALKVVLDPHLPKGSKGKVPYAAMVSKFAALRSVVFRDHLDTVRIAAACCGASTSPYYFWDHLDMFWEL